MESNYQKGFVVPLIGGIVALLIAGGVYWTWHKKGTEQNNIVAQNDVMATTTSIASNSTYDISDLGLKFMLPGALSDLTYKIYKLGNDQAVNSVSFSSEKLEADGCPTNALGYITYDKDQGGIIVANARHSDLYYIQPTSMTCGGIDVHSYVGTLQKSFENSLVSDDISNANSSVTLTSDWKTYTNSQHGFSIEYPNNFSISESNGAGFFAEQYLYDLSINVPTDYQKNTDFNIGRVDVIVSSSTVNCYISSPNGGALSSINTINGISFHYNSQQPMEDDAMGGQRGKYSLFASIHNSQCYRIEKEIGYRDSRGFTDPPYPPHFNEQAANADLDSIISTFKFAN